VPRRPVSVENFHIIDGQAKKGYDMVTQDTTKTLTTKPKVGTKGVNRSDVVTPEAPSQEALGQRMRLEKGQFCLQVDRQTKASYATYEAAEQAALVIKRGHPVVRVAVYDTVACVNKVIELPK
jgi:hypothetical protein